MIWEISCSPDQQVVIIKTHGAIPYHELPAQFEEAAHLARANDIDRFLFDETEMHINVSTIDIYDIPKLLIASGVTRTSRIAVVISTDENRVDNYQFLETVCVNQGLHLKIFFSLSKAFEWLML